MNKVGNGLTLGFLTLFLSLVLGLNPAFALRMRNGGLKEQTPTTRAIENALGHVSPILSASGLEETPWPVGTGREKGAEEFKDFGIPQVILDVLRNPQSTFVDRVLTLAGYLGWSDAKLAAATGMGDSLVWDWRSLGTQEPHPATMKKVGDALRVDTVFLITGLPRWKAFRLAGVAWRTQLLMWERGMSQGELAQRMGKAQEQIHEILAGKTEPTRDVVFEMADVFEESPVLIETGFEPPSGSLLFNPVGRTGFSPTTPARKKLLEEKAQNLEEAFLQTWGTSGLPVDQWKSQIEADPTHHYPGLVYRLLSARPGALVHLIVSPPQVSESQPVLKSPVVSNGHGANLSPGVLESVCCFVEAKVRCQRAVY